MASKNIISFFMLLIPIVVIIAAMRAVALGSFSMPDAQSWVVMFSQVGTNDDLMNVVRDFNMSKDVYSSIQITDLASFFESVGTFFGMVGNAIAVFFQILTVPFRVLGWLFGLLSY